MVVILTYYNKVHVNNISVMLTVRIEPTLLWYFSHIFGVTIFCSRTTRHMYSGFQLSNPGPIDLEADTLTLRGYHTFLDQL